MSVEILLEAANIFGILGFLAICSLFFPHKVVESERKLFLQVYKTYRKLTDRGVDATYSPPTDQYLAGILSEFFPKATDEPRKYTLMIRTHRAIGLVLFLILCIRVVGFVCYKLARS